MDGKRLILCVLSLMEYTLGNLMLFPELTDRQAVPKKRKLWMFTLLSSVVMSYNVKFTWVSTGMVLIMPVFFFIIYWLLFRKNTMMVYLWCVFYYVTGYLLKLVLLVVEGLLYRKNIIDVNNDRSSVLEIFFEGIMIAFLYLFYRVLKKKNLFIRALCSRYWKILAVVCIAEYEIMCYVMRDGMMRIQTHVLVADLAVLVAVAAGILAVLMHAIVQNISDERKIMALQYTKLEEYYQDLKVQYEALAKTNHEIRHERMYIRSCLTEKRTDEALQYLLEREKAAVREQKIWTGIKLVDFMLNYNYEQMQKREIRFVLQCDIYALPVTEHDFVVLFGNLLENAMEAAEQCEVGRRWIKLRMENKNGGFLLQIKNSSIHKPNEENGIIVTSKKRKDAHGWGLKNVRELVEKYDGTMNIRHTEHEFEVRMMFWKLVEE